MIISETKVRVRYAEADRMGYAYYGNYAAWFEVGRVEALRELGISYRELEDQGIVLPVKRLEIDFFKPAYYDDLITVRTIIAACPSVRFEFDYKVYNVKDELLCKAHTTLVFFDKAMNKPCRPPLWLLRLIQPFFHVP